jgi:hypothetical protein
VLCCINSCAVVAHDKAETLWALEIKFCGQLAISSVQRSEQMMSIENASAYIASGIKHGISSN